MEDLRVRLNKVKVELKMTLRDLEREIGLPRLMIGRYLAGEYIQAESGWKIYLWLQDYKTRRHTAKEPMSPITYEDRGGDSPATSIIIHGAQNEYVGVAAEYEFLAKKFGTANKDWKIVVQSTGETDGRRWDRMTLKLADGTMKTVYFDITEFFGNL